PRAAGAPRGVAHAARPLRARPRRTEVRGRGRGVGALRRPAHLHRLPLPRRRHALALPALPRVEHARRGARGAGGGNAVRTRPLALLLGASLLAALLGRPLAHGVAAASVLVFWATVLGEVLLPGVLLVLGANLTRGGDHALLLGQGATLGLA